MRINSPVIHYLESLKNKAALCALVLLALGAIFLLSNPIGWILLGSAVLLFLVMTFDFYFHHCWKEILVPGFFKGPGLYG